MFRKLQMFKYPGFGAKSKYFDDVRSLKWYLQLAFTSTTRLFLLSRLIMRRIGFLSVLKLIKLDTL